MTILAFTNPYHSIAVHLLFFHQKPFRHIFVIRISCAKCKNPFFSAHLGSVVVQKPVVEASKAIRDFFLRLGQLITNGDP